MSWGDSWGSSPCSNALRLAAAFMEGRELGGNGRTRVSINPSQTWLDYYYKDATIARWTPPSLLPDIIARKLAGEYIYETIPVMQFRCYHGDKGEARHLKGLGVDAEWQWGKRPFLICGVDASKGEWHTLAEWAELEKWEEPKKPAKPVYYPQHEPFINLTLPLFA